MMAFNVCFLCSVLLVLSAAQTLGKLLYFPSNDIELLLIGTKDKQLNNDEIISVARTATTPSQLPKDRILYTMRNTSKYFIFNNHTGEIKISRDIFQKVKDKDVFNIEIEATDETNKQRYIKFNMLIIIKLINEEFNCEKYIKYLCFWPKIKYQVLENQKTSFLGLLSSLYYKNQCKNYNLYYNIWKEKNKNKIKIEQNQFSKTWYLLTNTSLDRDLNGKVPSFNITVDCFVNGSNNYQQTISKVININVLDEDDNPLIPQTPPVVEVCLSSPDVKKDDSLKFSTNLLFNDDDTISVNNYETKILEDTENILHVNCSKFDNHILLRTGYHCEMQFRKDFKFKTLPYTTLLQVTDTTLEANNENRTVTITIQIKICKGTKPSALTEHTTKPTKSEIYPYMETKILRTAAPYARVAQPRDALKNLHLYHFHIGYDSSARYNKNGESLPAFNITEKDGIVYLQNRNLIKQKSISKVDLAIEWWAEDSKNVKLKNGSVPLYVIIVDEQNESCTDLENDIYNWPMCSSVKTPTECLATCGLSTGGHNTLEHIHKFTDRGTRCVWRGNRTKLSYETKEYQTCTPDIKTCPDKVCDALESLDHRICPQDCTEEAVMFGKHNKNTKKGIASGLGICTCSEGGQCVCLAEEPNKHIKSSKNLDQMHEIGTQTYLNETHMTGFLGSNKVHKAQPPCGPWCFMGIGLGVTLLIIVMGIMICRIRTWKQNEIREHKYISSVTALSHGYGGDYVHQTQPPILNNDSFTENGATGPLEFNFTTMNIIFNKKYTPDPKWEFPRCNLQIEQILGEGEFGRVLKARAKDIAGNIGYTTVAVKTLKENAQASELDDLISEFELLKEVSHPNVIRLLGVSMSPGGPVYLIIEYAEFGSLRNYLRKSRNLHTENVNSKSHDYNIVATKSEICTVTPKDILSFAWQISKGMAYLGDKKLVHRDLAARNVLVATGKICKISDFGLTRDVYEDNAYLKRSKGRVPIKWMAPESLADHVYTNRSDVWSFGILLWELVTLGGSPYPGVAIENLFTLLRSGYRMERPPNCSTQLYSIMQKCWEIDPVERPSFRSLTEKFETMLEDGVEYLNLNLHAVQNRAYFSTLNDTPNASDESKQLNVPKYSNDCMSPRLKSHDAFVINLLQNQTKNKCIDVQKLPIWAVSSPATTTSNVDYQNENNNLNNFGMSHYEVPKNSNLKTISNLNNRTDNRMHLSYIDMTLNNTEERPLLKTKSYDNLPTQRITKV